jgi:N-acetyl-beta-hexosaminidase
MNSDYNVIPKPQKTTLQEGNPFVLNQSTKISFPEGNKKLENVAQLLCEYIWQSTGYKLAVTSAEENKNAILFSIDSSVANKEGYLLNVNPTLIKISGSTENGIFYGVQTLRKSIPAVAQGASISFAPVNIEDAPRFSYRGMHLDVGRHTFTVDSIKRYIDILALHNENTFHWHLTEDQGWRIEIKKYPKLTELGSIRQKTTIGRNSGDFDNKPYGGFFTQEEIKEVVAYAGERFINVIPEIDLPGHMLAALHAYPEYGCTGGPYEVSPEFGVFEDVICAGNEEAMVFLENVLAEVMELFPSQYIHIGGDECPKTRWANCPKCQKRIKELGIRKDNKHTAEEYLQSYVINRMEKFVNSKGRNIIGWDETLEGGLAPNATVMSWRGMEGGIEAAKQKHNVIMTPGGYVYFDHYQSLDTDLEPLAIGGYTPISRVYEFEPVPASLEGDERNYVIGCQANVWTEYIPSFAQVEYMVMPRIAALCEVQWCQPEERNYEDFLKRLPKLVSIYDRENYNYAKHIYDVRAVYNSDTKTVLLTLHFQLLTPQKR